MGEIISSENSLNQHIKNKHPELWETIKAKHEQALEDAIKNDPSQTNEIKGKIDTKTKKLSFDEMPINFETEE